MIDCMAQLLELSYWAILLHRGEYYWQTVRIKQSV